MELGSLTFAHKRRVLGGLVSFRWRQQQLHRPPSRRSVVGLDGGGRGSCRSDLSHSDQDSFWCIGHTQLPHKGCIGNPTCCLHIGNLSRQCLAHMQPQLFSLKTPAALVICRAYCRLVHRQPQRASALLQRWNRVIRLH